MKNELKGLLNLPNSACMYIIEYYATNFPVV